MPSSASFLFAFFFVSLVFAKLLHLYIHLQSITAIDFIVYLPTFFLQDVFLACLARLLLRPRRTIPSFVGYILTSILTFVGNLISGLGKHIASVAEYLGTKIRPQKHVQHDPENVEPLMERPSTGDSASNDNRKSSTSSGGREEKHSRDDPSWQQRWCFIPSWVLTSTVLVFVGITAIVRPDKPFNHMSTSLPSRIRDSFRTTLVFCASNNEWPLKGLIDKTKWLDPSGDFKGWAPGTDNNKFVKQYRENPPKWLSEPIPAGFLKWDRNRYQNNYKDVGTDDARPNTLRDQGFYNPVNDPSG
ncbi:hypothetical protein ACKLNR_014452 [Fusarium oxysporum f. sp. zingiberi]